MSAFISYLKAAAIALVTVLFSLVVMLAMLIVGKGAFHPFARIWSKLLLALSGIKLEVSGEKLQANDQNYVLAANHSSFFDIPVILASCGKNANIVYKKSLENVPIWGWGLRMSPFIAVDRSRGRDSMAAIEKAIELIKAGDSIIIFPEGTRTKTGEMGDFKRGAFMMAARSGLPIVPVAIKGTFPLLSFKPFRIQGGKVSIHYSSPINVEGEGSAAEKMVMKQVHDEISLQLQKGFGT